MKVRTENIELVIIHNDIEYQVGACWTDIDDTYEVYYYIVLCQLLWVYQ